MGLARWLCVPSDNPEAAGFLLLRTGRVTILVSVFTLSVAINKLASKEVGCWKDGSSVPADECEGRVFYRLLKPSSMLPFMTLVTTVLNALLMPIIGTVVDFTPFRRQLLVASSITLVVANAALTAIAAGAWLIASVLLCTVVTPSLMTCSVITMAYMPELAQDGAVISKINAVTRMWECVFTLITLGLIAAPAQILSLGEVDTAILGQVETTLLGGILVALGCFHMGNRQGQLASSARVSALEPDRQVNNNLDASSSSRNTDSFSDLSTGQEGSDIGTEGVRWTGLCLAIRRVTLTLRTLNTDFPMSFRFICGAACWSGASLSMMPCFTAFVIVEINDTSLSCLLAAFIAGCIVGATCNLIVGTRYDAKHSLLTVLVLYIVVVASAMCLVFDEQTVLALCFATGICQGWIFPAQNSVLSDLVPGGRETEMMGHYIMATLSLTWLPPTFFFIMNEWQSSMKLGFIAGLFLFVVGLLFLVYVDMEEARARIFPTLHRRAFSSPSATIPVMVKSVARAREGMKFDSHLQLAVAD